MLAPRETCGGSPMHPRTTLRPVPPRACPRSLAESEQAAPATDMVSGASCLKRGLPSRMARHCIHLTRNGNEKRNPAHDGKCCIGTDTLVTVQGQAQDEYGHADAKRFGIAGASVPPGERAAPAEGLARPGDNVVKLQSHSCTSQPPPRANPAARHRWLMGLAGKTALAAALPCFVALKST